MATRLVKVAKFQYMLNCIPGREAPGWARKLRNVCVPLSCRVFGLRYAVARDTATRVQTPLALLLQVLYNSRQQIWFNLPTQDVVCDKVHSKCDASYPGIYKWA